MTDTLTAKCRNPDESNVPCFLLGRHHRSFCIWWSCPASCPQGPMRQCDWRWSSHQSLHQSPLPSPLWADWSTSLTPTSRTPSVPPPPRQIRPTRRVTDRGDTRLQYSSQCKLRTLKLVLQSEKKKIAWIPKLPISLLVHCILNGNSRIEKSHYYLLGI